MTSINTNIAAQSALRTLQSTNSQLDATQQRISTGLKISEAKDNAAYWSISTSMKSDNRALGTVKDALALGAGAVDVAYQGLNAALDTLNEIKAKLTAASNPAADRVAIQAELDELFDQLTSFADAASFGGENWLEEGAEGTKIIVTGFTRVDDAITLKTIEIDVTDYVLETLADGVSEIAITADSTQENLEEALGTVEAAITKVSDAAAKLGAYSSRIESQTSFVSNLIDTIDKGISGLVDADMNEESTRLQALQVKQQLGVQALSIANQSAQNVLRLFQ